MKNQNSQSEIFVKKKECIQANSADGRKDTINKGNKACWTKDKAYHIKSKTK